MPALQRYDIWDTNSFVMLNPIKIIYTNHELRHSFHHPKEKNLSCYHIKLDSHLLCSHTVHQCMILIIIQDAL